MLWAGCGSRSGNSVTATSGASADTDLSNSLPTPVYREGDIVTGPQARPTLKNIPLLDPYVGEYKGTVAVGYYGTEDGTSRDCYVNVGTQKTNLLGRDIDGYFVQIAETGFQPSIPATIWQETIWPIKDNNQVYMAECSKRGPTKGKGRCLSVAYSATEYPQLFELELVNGQAKSAYYRQTIVSILWPLPIPSNDSHVQ